MLKSQSCAAECVLCSTQPAIQPSRWASERRTLGTSAIMSLTVHSILRGALPKAFPARLFWPVRRRMVMGSVGDACRLPATSLPLIESRVYRVARVAPILLRRPGRDRQAPPKRNVDHGLSLASCAVYNPAHPARTNRRTQSLVSVFQRSSWASVASVGNRNE
jgi:hypothetical protein